jgi:uncharacterized protein (DUF433 family)
MQSSTHIEITPGVCSGRPRVAGTRIRVENVVRWTEQGMSPDDIVAAYPQLTLASVDAALAFYSDNRAEIERQVQEDKAFLSAFEANRTLGHATTGAASIEADADSISS